jgi:serine protease Do
MNKKNTLYGKVIYSLLIFLIAFFSGIFGAVVYESQLKTKTESNTSSNVSTMNTSSSNNKMDTADTVEQVADCVVDVSAENSVGSGVIYSKDGYIITNEHVIRKAKKITVKLRNQKSYAAALVGIDSENDIAVIKIKENNLNPVKFAEFSKVRLGETTIVIGNPLGELSGSVSDGVVSAKERLVNVDGKQMKLMQTCAEINSGNSGGGVFRLNGELAGIVVAKSSGENLEGLGFAIPSDDVKNSVEKILKK